MEITISVQFTQSIINASPYFKISFYFLNLNIYMKKHIMMTYYNINYIYYSDKRYGNLNEELYLAFKLSENIVKDFKDIDEEYNI